MKVEGTDDIYDLTPAPGTVTEEGTFLNVENLLKDTTAALLGGDSSMVPDEALVALKRLIDGVTPEQIGAAQIAQGSYTGSNTYGSSSPNSLTFDFEPKYVHICAAKEASANSHNQAVFADIFVGIGGVRFTNSYSDSYGDTVGALTVIVSGNTVSWYSTENAVRQCNASGVQYYYVAFG